MVLSDLIVESLKASVGLIVGFYTDNDFYYEGKILACDGVILKYEDRKQGVKLVSVARIKEVSLK